MTKLDRLGEVFFMTKNEITQQVIREAINYAVGNQLNDMIIASVTGDSLPSLYDVFRGNIICVTHAYGFLKPGECEFPEELRTEYS